MAGWSLVEFAFNASQNSLPSAILTFDLNLNYADPGIDFDGTETNTIYAEMREVGGDLWIVQNASFNGTNWIPKNIAYPVFASLFKSPAAVGQAGYMQRLKCAAGTNPVVWTTIWQIDANGIETTAGTIQRQAQTATGAQLVDGSTNTVTYITDGGYNFATNTDRVFLTVSNLSNTTDLLGLPVILTKSSTGFTYYIPGGNPGDTATVDYLVYGH